MSTPEKINLTEGWDKAISWLEDLLTKEMTDVDNLIKETQDIIVKKGYIEDDRKIIYLSAEKIKSKEEKIVVEIRSWE